MANQPPPVSSTTQGTPAAGNDSRVVAADIQAIRPESQTPAAYADGAQPAVTASIASGGSALTVASALFATTDVGKYIEVPGAGVAGATLYTTILAYVSPTQVTLAGPAFTALISAAVILTYGHDDTSAMQAAINAGRWTELTAGKTYLVRNVIMPAYVPAGLTPTAGIVTRGGQATIRAISGGTVTYLAATPNWVTNGAYAGNPILCKNVTFDAGNVSQNAFVDFSYGSIYDQCYFTKATQYGWWGPSTTQNGTAITNATEATQFLSSQSYANGSDGLHLNNKVTDVQIRGGFYYDNGGYGIYSATGAGLLIESVHTYGDTAAGGVAGLYVDGYGYNTAVANNIFEDGVSINSLQNSTAIATFGPGNTVAAELQVNFKDHVSYEVFRSLGNNFIQIGSSSGYIFQGYNGPGHTIISEGDNFVGSPFGWAGSLASSGRIIARGSYSRTGAYGNTGMALHDGCKFPPVTPQPLRNFNKLSISQTP